MDKFLSIATESAKAVRNIYNQKEIKDFLKKIIESKNVEEDNLIKWLNSNVKNYILKEQPMKLIESLTEVIEDWAILGVKNKTLSKVILDENLYNNLLHVIDYLRMEYPNKELSRLNVQDAINQSIKWIEEQEKVDDDLNGRINFIDSFDGYQIVEILNEQSLKYEGSRMNHCIGLYYVKDITKKNKRAFSLRDSNNIPHATLLYDKETNTIEEIKANSNHKVKKEYQKHLVDFLNHFSFSFSTIKDYDYIENIHYNENQFVYSEVLPKNRNVTNVFRFNDMRIPNLMEKSITKYKSYFLDAKNIKDNLFIDEITKYDNSVINKEFKFMSINNIVNDACAVLKKLNVKTLEIKNIKDRISKIENNFATTIKIGNTSSNIKISNLVSKSVKFLSIIPQSNFKINNIDLSFATDLESLVIHNCTVNKLTLPPYVRKIEIINSIINETNISIIDNLFIKNTYINNEILNCKTIHAYNSTFNENNIVNNELIITDKNNKVISPNKINNETIKITNKKLIKDDLSLLYNQNTSIIIPEIFSYPNKELKLHKIDEQIINICKDEYKNDVEFLCKYINLEISYFNMIKKIDINYISYKSESSNRIILKKQFSQYLQNSNALSQLLLFENLRVLNPTGVNLEQFRKLIKDEPHEYIKRLIKNIEVNPYYLLNNDYNILLEVKSKKNIDKFYYEIIKKFEKLVIENDYVFKSEVFKDYWKKSKNIEITNELKEFIEESEIKTQSLLKMNLFEEIKNASEILIEMNKEELILTTKNKEQILWNMFDNHPITDKKSEKIVHEIYNLIYDLKIDHILTRNDIIHAFIYNYTKIISTESKSCLSFN